MAIMWTRNFWLDVFLCFVVVIFFFFGVCVCVCACVRACVRACVCVSPLLSSLVVCFQLNGGNGINNKKAM